MSQLVNICRCLVVMTALRLLVSRVRPLDMREALAWIVPDVRVGCITTYNKITSLAPKSLIKKFRGASGQKSW